MNNLIKKRIVAFDVMRVIGLIIIVSYHFACCFFAYGLNGGEYFIHYLSGYKNGDWGYVGVSLFLLLSGAALMNQYIGIFSIKSFFKKRFIRLFPIFYFIYAIALLYNICTKTFFSQDIPSWKILLTFSGIDGYFANSFHLVGEWFTGCIIIIYFIFPIIRAMIIRHPIIWLLINGVVSLYIIFFNPFIMVPEGNVLVNLFIFSMGGTYYTYIKNVNKYIPILSAIILIIIIFVPFGHKNPLFSIAIAFCMFLIAIYVSRFINNEKIKQIFKKISELSYIVYLTHHFFLDKFLPKLSGKNFTGISELLLVLISLFIIYIISLIINISFNKFLLFLKYGYKILLQK